MEHTKSNFLALFLANAVFDGWSEENFIRTQQESQFEPSLLAVAFPQGSIDVLRFYHAQLNIDMIKKLQENTLEQGITQTIRHALHIRFNLMQPHKTAIERSIAFLSLPHFLPVAAQFAWDMADAIWNTLEDNQRGFSYWSKRTSLSALYSSALLYWLGDEKKDLYEFIDRRINNLMAFHKIKQRAQNIKPFRKPPCLTDEEAS